jgi:hypothetical protein
MMEASSTAIEEGGAGDGKTPVPLLGSMVGDGADPPPGVIPPTAGTTAVMVGAADGLPVGFELGVAVGTPLGDAV